MNGRQALILYSRPDCHLCDVAASLLRGLGLGFRVVNIENELALVRLYGDHVPVLQRGDDGGATLGWPFTEEQLHEFLGEIEEV